MNSRYQIQANLAEGGRGAVYRAWDSQLGREVAIKKVRSEAVEGSAELLDDLVKEARVLSALQHPNVVTVFDVGVDEEGAFIVMELVKGETLEDTVAKGAMTEADFEVLVQQSLEGMIAAHAAGLIHLDLKPQNLMITWLPSGSFQVKILDFGLAMAAAQPVVQETDSDGAILGSVFFMAPEQFERSPVGVQTDLYSLGCIFYYALTKRYPFRGKTAPEVMTSHLYHQVTPLAKLRPDLPPFIAEWVDWLFQRVPEDRPGSTAQALKAFKQRKLPKKAKAAEEVVAVAVAVEDEVVAAAAAGTASDRLKVKRDLAPQGLLGEASTLKAVGGARSGGGAPHSRVAPQQQINPLGKWSCYTLPVLVGLVLIAGSWYWIRKMAATKRQARFVELVQADVPEVNQADIKLLLSYLASEETSAAAGFTLGKIKGGDGLDAAILKAAREARTRYEKINLLNVVALRETKGGVDLAISRLGDSDDEVKKAALNTLGTLAGADQVERLIEVSKGVSEGVEKFAEQALVAIVRRADDADKAAAPVLAAYRTGMGEARHRALLVRVLGQLGGKTVLAELKKAVDGRDLEVRKAAITSLGRWPNNEPLQLLEQRMQVETDPASRLLILMAAAQLMMQPGDQSMQELFEIGTRFYALAGDRREQDQVLSTLGRVECPEAVAFFQQLAADEPGRKTQAEGVARRLSERLESLVKMDGGKAVLPALNADFNRSGALTVAGGSLLYWESEADWASWLVQVNKAGSYKLRVMQAHDGALPGSYEVLVAGQTLAAQSVITGDPDDYQLYEVGEAKVGKPGVYRVVLRVRKLPQGGSLFRLKELRMEP